MNDFQLLDVIDSELPALNDLCSKLQEGYEYVRRSDRWRERIEIRSSPKLAMVVVKKRGSARFFARDPRDSRKLFNPPPGTIIDHTVTNQGILSIHSRRMSSPRCSRMVRFLSDLANGPPRDGCPDPFQCYLGPNRVCSSTARYRTVIRLSLSAI